MAHPRIPEVFFDIVQLDRTNSETVFKRIMECYTSRDIDLPKVRGQTYDMTSSMSSAVNSEQYDLQQDHLLAMQCPYFKSLSKF